MGPNGCKWVKVDHYYKKPSVSNYYLSKNYYNGRVDTDENVY